MFSIKNKIIKKAKEIVKKGGGANAKNKILITRIIQYLKENNLTPEEFENELKQGKGRAIITMLTKGNNINPFIKDLMKEVRKKYYAQTDKK